MGKLFIFLSFIFVAVSSASTASKFLSSITSRNLTNNEGFPAHRIVEGSVVKLNCEDDIFHVHSGQRRKIPNMKHFHSLKKTVDDIVVIDCLDVTKLDAIAPIPKSFDSDVYYGKRTYWNDIPSVNSEINRRITGHENMSWELFALRLHNHVPFQRALSINAGNGWVERQMVEFGLIKSALGTDLFQNFVDEANQKASSLNYNLTYEKV